MSGDGGGDFESPLDELFVEGARFKEPSAAERREWAKRSEAAARRRKRQERKVRRRGKLRTALPVLLLVGVVLAILVAQNQFGGDDSATAGLPDEVRVVYAVPSDVAVDHGLVDAIRNEITVVDAWFEDQAGRTPNWVDDDGTVAVETKSLEVTTTAVEQRPDAGSLIADEFRDSDGNLPDDEILLVFVPIALESLCGESGEVIVVWVGACGDTPSTATTTLDDGVSGTIAHEVVHSMGAVAPCAPHYGRNGHVTDLPNDIMYDPIEGAVPGAPNDLLLDPGHDDYFKHGDNECSDIDDSPLWD